MYLIYICLCICKYVYIWVFLCTFVASEANAIDYARGEGHYLGSHCDDR